MKRIQSYNVYILLESSLKVEAVPYTELVYQSVWVEYLSLFWGGFLSLESWVRLELFSNYAQTLVHNSRLTFQVMTEKLDLGVPRILGGTAQIHRCLRNQLDIFHIWTHWYGDGRQNSDPARRHAAWSVLLACQLMQSWRMYVDLILCKQENRLC